MGVSRLTKFYIFLLLLTSGTAGAQSLWTKAVLDRDNQWEGGGILPQAFEAYHLDDEQLVEILANAPSTFEANQPSPALLEVPLGDEIWVTFHIREQSVFHPDLAAKYPEIRTYRGFDPLFPARWIHLEMGPAGFSAMVTEPGAPPLLFDPLDRKTGEGPILVYAKPDYISLNPQAFVCHTSGEELHLEETEGERDIQTEAFLRIYRLALACTAEYGIFHGGTKPLVLAAMATTLNRINDLFERDLGVRLQLVANNDDLIFFNPATDPYDNGNVNAMLGQNQQTCDALIGSANYDIGHVFGTSGGGVATLYSPCNNNNKARAATGLANPKGDPFDVDYVAHEFGHQFGCNHTFNNSCSGNRHNPTAYEPGSGSTIMGYSGVCSPGVQDNSDAYFHGGNLMEAKAFIVNGNGNTCPVLEGIGNQSPIVSAGPDYFIPRSTPFELTATGSDPDGDSLTYTWEQMDNGIATMPPVSSNAIGPLFRSISPTSSPTRVFPNLSDLLANINPTWEVLPSVARTLNFRVTARDNHPGHGRWAQDALSLTVVGQAGPFQVTQPNTALTWTVGDTVSVQWQVASTHLSPILCQEVDILLSTDGGVTFSTLLAGNVPNTGQKSVVVPFMVSPNCRIKIKGVNHVFFDVSNTNFTIQEPAFPSFLAEGLTDTLQLCRTTSDTINLQIALQSLSGFDGDITITAQWPSGMESDLPAQWSLQGKDTIHFKVWYAAGPFPPVDQATIVLNSSTTERRLEYVILAFDPLTQPVLPIYPTDLSDSISSQVTLVWTTVEGAGGYLLEVATFPDFNPNGLISLSTSDTSATLQLLDNTIYFWRVMPIGACPVGYPLEVWTFRTKLEICANYTPSNLPIIIPNDQAFFMNSLVQVPEAGVVTRIEVYVNAVHDDLNDLTLRLLSPLGTGLSLIAKACSGSKDVLATFSDEGASFGCSGGQPGVLGFLKPQTGPFSLFEGFSTQGNWALRVVDDAIGAGGSLEDWRLTLCRRETLPSPPDLITLDTLFVPYVGEATLDESTIQVLDTNGGQIRYMLHQLPQHGTLNLNGQPLEAGDSFLDTDLQNGNVTYAHNGGTDFLDSFRLDAINEQTLGWLPGLWVPVRLFLDFQGSILEETPIRCPGENTGSLRIEFGGGKEPLNYRMLPNGLWQMNPVFGGLSEGFYSFEVRDANGFFWTSQPYDLQDPAPLMVTTLLQGDSLRVMVSGGEAPYLYMLGSDSSLAPVLFVPTSGSYTLIVQDHRGCTYTETLELSILSGVVTIIHVACAGDSSGILSVTPSGGIPPYRYRLGLQNWGLDSSFEGLAAGSYDVYVEDSSPAQRFLGVFTIEEPEPLLFTGQQTADSTLTLEASGGSPPYLYRLGMGTFQDLPIFSNLVNGNYTLYVLDDAGCLDSTTVAIINTGILDWDKESPDVRVFPNPANGTFFVERSESSNEDLQWELLDALGRPVAGGSTKAARWQISVYDQPAGWYILRLDGKHTSGALLVRLE